MLFFFPRAWALFLRTVPKTAKNAFMCVLVLVPNYLLAIGWLLLNVKDIIRPAWISAIIHITTDKNHFYNKFIAYFYHFKKKKLFSKFISIKFLPSKFCFKKNSILRTTDPKRKFQEGWSSAPITLFESIKRGKFNLYQFQNKTFIGFFNKEDVILFQQNLSRQNKEAQTSFISNFYKI